MHNFKFFILEGNETLKQTSSVSLESSIQAIQAAAAAYSTKRTEVKVSDSPLSGSDGQSVLVSVQTWGDPTHLASFFVPSI